jgi:hypothetical protein
MRIRPLLLVSVSLLAVVYGTVTAEAAEVNAQTAGELKQVIENFISSSAGNDVTMSLGGNIEVMPAGDHYNFSVPDIRLTGTEDRSETLILYKVQGTLTPTETSDHYTYTLALPSPIAQMVDATGMPLSTLTAASHKISGVWAKGQDTLPAADISLKDIAWAPAQPGLSINNRNIIKIAAMEMQMTNKPSTTTQTAFDGKMDFKLSGLSMADTLDSEIFSLGGVSVTSTYLNAQPAPSEDAQSVDQFFQLIANMPDGSAKFAIELSDMKASFGQMMDNNKQVWQLGKFAMLLDSATVKGMSDSTIKISHEGLSGQNTNPALAELIPASGSFDLALTGVPVQAGAKKFLELTPQDKAAVGLPQPLRDLIAANPFKITLNNLALQAQTMSLQAGGTFVTSPTSTTGMVGDLTAKFTGLDETIGKLTLISRSATTPDQANAIAQAATMFLSMAQMMGQAEIVEAGKMSNRTYKFALAPDGAVTLDGAPVLSLAPAPAATTQPAIAEGTISPALPAPAAQ